MVAAVCVPCQRAYRCEKNSVRVTQGDRIWAGDRWKCPECGHEIITGWARQPIAERFQGPVYDRALADQPPEFEVTP